MKELESARALRGKGVDFRLIELRQKAVSVGDVVRYSVSEIAIDEICKTILLKGQAGEDYVVFLLGSHRIDFKKVRDVVGARVRIAKAEEVEATTGVEPGAVCPILLDIPILLDHRVLEKEKINFGSGDHLYGLEIRTRDLGKVVNYQLVDVTSGHS